MAEVNLANKECAIFKIDLVSLAKKQRSCRLAPENRYFDPDGNITLLFTRAFVPKGPSMFVSIKSKIKMPKVGEVRHLVSSKHLSLASPVFKAMLSSGFSEGDALRIYGKVEIPLPEDCHEAFGVIMNAIHGKPHLIPGPRDVTPKLVANIAILLDKYQFEPIFGHFRISWFEKLDGDCKFCANDRTILSFFGSCFGFQHDEAYLRAHFKVAWPYFQGAVPEDFYSPNPSLNSLPIPTMPDEFLELLQRTRSKAIEESFRMIDGYIGALGWERCCFCSSNCKYFATDQLTYGQKSYETCNNRLAYRLMSEARNAGLCQLGQLPSSKDLSFEQLKSRIGEFDLEINDCDAGRRCKAKLMEELEEIEERCDEEWVVKGDIWMGYSDTNSSDSPRSIKF